MLGAEDREEFENYLRKDTLKFSYVLNIVLFVIFLFCMVASLSLKGVEFRVIVQTAFLFGIQVLAITPFVWMARKNRLWMIDLLQPVAIFCVIISIYAVNFSGFLLDDDNGIRG